ncbi:MAG: S1C family serine protease [Verrucomicrobiota bacterium]
MTAASDSIPPILRASYAAAPGDGKVVETTAIPMPGQTTVVTVSNAEEKRELTSLQLGTKGIRVNSVEHDPVSRLDFFAVERGAVPSIKWNDEVGGNATAALRVLESNGFIPCRSTGWVKHVDGRILPFALLNVSFSQAVPSPGTAVIDDVGAVVGIVFQASGAGNDGFVIPVEAIHRVRRDVADGGALVRGWLGLALRSEATIPQISRILAESPAALAGIQVNDVILSIGSRQITDYADAANAFFYVIPGEPVVIGLRRGEKNLEITVKPTEPPVGI